MSARGPILVTGASGFIGGHLCAALAARGDRVRALYRRRVPPPELAALAFPEVEGRPAGFRPVELFNADLGDGERVAQAAAGCSAVIHVAALASDWGDYRLFKRQNYDATALLLAEAEGAGARAFVYISSAVVSGFGPHVDSTEEGPYYPLKYPYQTTKRLAERRVLDRNRPGFRTVALRPGNVYGPGDRTTVYPMLDAVRAGLFGYLGSGETFTCPIYVDDLCAGILAALDREEAAGEAIILTDGEKVRWKDYAEALFAAALSRRRPSRLPIPLGRAAARLMTACALAVGSSKPPLLTMYRVEQVSQDYHFSIAKARRLLGFEPKIGYREGLKATAAAYQKAQRGAAE